MDESITRRLKSEGWEGNWHQDYVAQSRQLNPYFDKQYDLSMPLGSDGNESDELRKQGFVGVWRVRGFSQWVY